MIHLLAPSCLYTPLLPPTQALSLTYTCYLAYTYNSPLHVPLLQVCVDMLLGITLGQLLYRHAHKIAFAATQLCVWLQTEMLKRAIESFKHAPFGIKFNPLITHKVGYVLKFVVREFAEGVAFTAPVHVFLVM